jgi:hypothetical protein
MGAVESIVILPCRENLLCSKRERGNRVVRHLFKFFGGAEAALGKRYDVGGPRGCDCGCNFVFCYHT